MGVRSLLCLRSRTRSLINPIFRTLHNHFSSLPVPARQPDLVNEISRILSDHRDPRHDLESSLTSYSSNISIDVVEQVLKRCRNLGFSAHRFFLWATRIPGFKHSAKSYRILVDILGGSKQFAILWDFLTEMRECPGFEIDPSIFWLVFRGYSKAGLPGDAIRAFQRMTEFHLKPTVCDLDCLLRMLCRWKHVKHAQQFFDRVKGEIEPTAKTYSILVSGWGDFGELGNARKVFDEMFERRCDVDVVAYNCMLEALCKGGCVEEGYQMFKDMGSRGIQPDAGSYSIFIRAYCVKNDVHSAFRVLHRMRRYDLVPNLYTYNCIIGKLCKDNKVEEAYQILNEMIERGANPNAWSYNAILAYHCNHSEVNRATALISRMVKDGCSPDRHSYNMVLKLLIRIGRFDRATEVWEGMAEKGFFPSASTYSVMVHGLCKKRGKLEEACKYYEMMIDDGIPPYSSTVEMLRNQLLGRGLLDNIEILARKMEQSTSCSIQEMAAEMRGNKTNVRSRSEETESESDYEPLKTQI